MDFKMYWNETAEIFSDLKKILLEMFSEAKKLFIDPKGFFMEISRDVNIPAISVKAVFYITVTTLLSTMYSMLFRSGDIDLLLRILLGGVVFGVIALIVIAFVIYVISVIAKLPITYIYALKIVVSLYPIMLVSALVSVVFFFSYLLSSIIIALINIYALYIYYMAMVYGLGYKTAIAKILVGILAVFAVLALLFSVIVGIISIRAKDLQVGTLFMDKIANAAKHLVIVEDNEEHSLKYRNKLQEKYIDASDNLTAIEKEEAKEMLRMQNEMLSDPEYLRAVEKMDEGDPSDFNKIMEKYEEKYGIDY